MTAQLSSFALPTLRRGTPSGKPSPYQDELALLEIGGQGLVETEIGDAPDAADKASQKFSTAIAQYRKTTGDKAKFTVRKFADPEGSGKTFVGVWKIEGEIVVKPRKPKAPAASTDGAAASTGDANGTQG